MKSGNGIRTSHLIFIVFLLSVAHNTPMIASLPDFPIGLTLVYDDETVYGWGTTHTWIDTYDIVRWDAADNSSVIIEHGYLRSSPWINNSYEVSLPSWDYEYYSDEYNRTMSSWMRPLWIDVSTWTTGENITIPENSEHSRIYQVQGEVYVELDDDRHIWCWEVKTEYVSNDDMEYRYTLRYDIEFGILIMVNSVRWPDFGDFSNHATHESILTSSNIMELLLVPPQFAYPIDGFLFLGILVEVVVILYFVLNRIPKKPS